MSTPPVVAASLQMPSDPAAPVVLDFYLHALKVAVVAPEGVSLLAKEFDKPAVYMLLAERTLAAATTVYVGKASNARQRLAQHRAKPRLAWWRGVVVLRDTTHGFNSAEVGYLEGRLARQLASLPGVEVQQGREDLDTTLPDHLLLQLDGFVPTIIAALRVAGLDVRPAPPVPDVDDGETTRAGRATIPGTVADLLATGLLKAGARLRISRAERTGEAVVNTAGQLVVAGVAYDSPSTAGRVALGVASVNGWTSWTHDDGSGVTLDALRTQWRAQSAARA